MKQVNEPGAPPAGLRLRVEVGDMQVSMHGDLTLVAYALGSCVGLAVHDPIAGVGGLAHIQLPSRSRYAEVDAAAPWAYADLAVPELFRSCYALGAKKNQMKVVLAGGAALLDPRNFFEIGRKNLLAVKKLLWQNGVFISAERSGGQSWRTLSLAVASGQVRIKTPQAEEVF